MAMQVDNTYAEKQPKDDYQDEYTQNDEYEESEQPESSSYNSLVEELANISLNAVFTPLERQRFASGACFRCGQMNHIARNCPTQPNRRPSTSQTRPTRPPPRRFPNQKGKQPNRPTPSSGARSTAHTLHNIMSEMTEEERSDVLSELQGITDF